MTEDGPPLKKARRSASDGSPASALAPSVAILKSKPNPQPKKGFTKPTTKQSPTHADAHPNLEKDEDARIAWLEAQLGKKGKWNDGFDGKVISRRKGGYSNVQ